MKKTILLFTLACALSVPTIQAMQPKMVVGRALRTFNPEYEGQLPHTALVELRQESYKFPLPHAHKTEVTKYLLIQLAEVKEPSTLRKITFKYSGNLVVEHDVLTGISNAFDEYADCE